MRDLKKGFNDSNDKRTSEKEVLLSTVSIGKIKNKWTGK